MRYSVERREARGAGGARSHRLARGSINSPKLLELSGIGQADRLRALGITPVHELQGVGENLRDHYSPRVKFAITRDEPHLQRQCPRLAAGARGAEVRAVPRGLPRLDVGADPHVLPHAAGARDAGRHDLDRAVPLRDGRPGAARRRSAAGITMNVNVLRSESTGSIHIKSADPAEPPAIRFNFLSTEHDRDRRAGRHPQGPRADGDLAAQGGHRRGDRARRASADRRRAARLGAQQRRDDLSPGRHLQDGQRSDGGGRSRAAGARHRRPARRRRLDHADPDQRQHQRALHHDRREVRRDGAGRGGAARARRRHDRRRLVHEAAPQTGQLLADDRSPAPARVGGRAAARRLTPRPACALPRLGASASPGFSARRDSGAATLATVLAASVRQ